MRITHRMISNNANVNLQHSLNRLQDYSNKLSTGKLFQRASENPVGVGRVINYTSVINRNEQYRLNMNQARGWLENTEMALQNSLDVLQRIRELAVYGANETLTAEDRRAILPEVGEFIDHLIGVANTEVNGLYIFGGHQTLEKPYEKEFVHAVKTNYLGPVHTGQAVFTSELEGSFHEDEEIGLIFTINDSTYKISVLADEDPAQIFEAIREAIQAEPGLQDHISVSYDPDRGTISFSRKDPGNFTIEAETDEAFFVMPGLEPLQVENAVFTTAVFEGTDHENIELRIELYCHDTDQFIDETIVVPSEPDLAPLEIFDRIQTELAATALVDHINLVFNDINPPHEGELTFERITPGYFTLTALSEEAGEVFGDLPPGEEVYVEAVYQYQVEVEDDNITAVNRVAPNSFLPGEYAILTGKTADPYPVNEATRVFAYSQSGEKIVSSINAVDADWNQSLSLVVTAVEGDSVTFSYEYTGMDPARVEDDRQGSGVITPPLDKTGGPVELTIGDVTYEIDLADADISVGDRIVVNTAAETAGETDLVHLHGDGDEKSLFTFAFDAGALVDNNEGVHPFSFYSLDENRGGLFKSSLELTWGENFLTADNPDYPAAGFEIRVHDGSRAARDQEVKIIAEGLQSGVYGLNKIMLTPVDDLPAGYSEVQNYFQGNAQSVFTGTRIDGEAYPVTVDSDVSASVLLEVTAVDPEKGTVKFSYNAHQYRLNGEYLSDKGVFTLNFGQQDMSPAVISLGESQVTIENLDQLSVSEAGSYRVGDRAVLNITPSVDGGTTVDQVRFSGEYRNKKTHTDYFFNPGVLEQDLELRKYSLETFEKTPDRGRVYDGMMVVNEDVINVMQLPQNNSYVYNDFGFPVPAGDNNDRILEISPFQEVTINLPVDKAFGENQEIFKAAFDVYGALKDNDRETLGGSALKNMDRAIDHILECLSQVGARTNRVEAMENTLADQNLYLREIRSKIEDIDLAEMITEFMMQENAYRAALATTQMMMQPTLIDYLR